MIYISSSCVKNKKISGSIQTLVNNGFKNIELSGGSEYYDGFENELVELKDRYGLNYRCHNYFPPPKEHFVLNLASLRDEIYEKSFLHFKNSIELSKKLGSKKFGLHAGFFIDIKVSEIGKKISKDNLFDKDKSIERFCQGYQKLKSIADDNNVELYLENNVFSDTNFKTYSGNNFFMLTNYQEYKELSSKIDFKLLLDVAHLKVSSCSLDLDFDKELSNMLSESDYIHVSDNDALSDSNNKLTKKSPIIALLQKQNLDNKDFTLEIYDGMENIKKSYDTLKEIV